MSEQSPIGNPEANPDFTVSESELQPLQIVLPVIPERRAKKHSYNTINTDKHPDIELQSYETDGTTDYLGGRESRISSYYQPSLEDGINTLLPTKVDYDSEGRSKELKNQFKLRHDPSVLPPIVKDL